MLILTVFISKKTNKICRALVYELRDGTRQVLTFDVKSLLALADLKPSELNELDVGDYVIKEGGGI